MPLSTESIPAETHPNPSSQEDHILPILHSKFTNLDAKFAHFDTKFVDFDTKFADFDTKFADFDAKFAAIDENIAQILTRLERIEVGIRNKCRRAPSQAALKRRRLLSSTYPGHRDS
ncbi:hypothetical protein HK102_000136 [Quaeritorhiza haematococci]|nr:hypothetical protein HK102_000136 [Quaeritorhiza haematococci]